MDAMTASRSWPYPLAIALFVAVIGLVLHQGERRLTPHRASTPEISASAPAQQFVTFWTRWRENAATPFGRLLLQILVVIAAARVFGRLARFAGQPSVVGEIAAGIALGPSFLGGYFPRLSSAIFPSSSLGILQILSQVGIVLFMFLVGLELNWRLVRAHARAAVAVSNVSVLFPFLLGVLAAVPLYPTRAPAAVSFQSFGLFMGIAMSITAFPVLARILEERSLSRSAVGSLALTCAAVDDVTAWTLLTFVVAVVTSGGALATLSATLGTAVLFTAFMVLCARPILRNVLQPRIGSDPIGKDRVVLIIALFLASALATEVIGVHALFGAFLAGTVMPTGDEFRAALRDRLESFSGILLPLFFAFTGLRTDLRLFADISGWVTCLAIVLLATLGKLGGSALTARVMGMDWNSAFLLGALMNTRGLMELIALNVGFDLGVISADMFAVLVVMALVTTALTAPLVDLALARQAPASRVSQPS